VIDARGVPKNLCFSGENNGSKLIPNRFQVPGIHAETPPIWFNQRGHLNFGVRTPRGSGSA
jgi:hypothetical protein